MMNWNLAESEKPPLGVPLIVTVWCKWKTFPEVLGPVYRLKNAANGSIEYVNFGPNGELGTIGGVIGPSNVTIKKWAFWPEVTK